MGEANNHDRWNQRYCDGDLPWDRKSSCPHLAEVLSGLELELPADNQCPEALEIGCGSGTNAIYMASQGFRVVAVDLAPRAIEMAKVKAKASGAVGIDFKVCDFVKQAAVKPGSINFVYDRGCFHSVDGDDRAMFVQRVANSLGVGGYWFTLCGNADEDREEGVVGPPQLSAGDIVEAVEPRFKILKLEQVYFHNEDGSGHMAWRCLMVKR